MINFEQKNPYHYLDVWNHTIESINEAPSDETLRLTMLFHDIAKPICHTIDELGIGHFYGHPSQSAEKAVLIMKRLKFDNETICQVHELILYHDADLLGRNKNVKRWLNKIGEARLRQLVQVKMADIKSQSKEFYIERAENLQRVLDCIDYIIERNQCFCLKDLAIDGRDLINHGVNQGRDIGIILHRLMDKVIEDKVENTKVDLLHEMNAIIAELI